MPSSLADLNSQPILRDTVEQTRLFMRDYAELNRLTKGVDHSDRHIMWAVLDTLSDWKSTPPFVVSTLEDVVARGLQSVFIRGVAASLLESLMFLHMRNFLNYSAGGTNIQVENPQLLQQAIQYLRGESERKRDRALLAINLDNALTGGGGVPSEYTLLSTFWGAY